MAGVHARTRKCDRSQFHAVKTRSEYPQTAIGDQQTAFAEEQRRLQVRTELAYRNGIPTNIFAATALPSLSAGLKIHLLNALSAG